MYIHNDNDKSYSDVGLWSYDVKKMGLKNAIIYGYIKDNSLLCDIYDEENCVKSLEVISKHKFNDSRLKNVFTKKEIEKGIKFLLENNYIYEYEGNGLDCYSLEKDFEYVGDYLEGTLELYKLK